VKRLSSLLLPVQHLSGVEERLWRETRSSFSSVQLIVDHLFSAKGKLLRPLIAIASAMCFGEITSEVLDVAAAVELVHTASLVHDDVVDGASERRGVETVGSRWGSAIAVLLGDVLLARSLSLLTPYTEKGAVAIVSNAITRMCESEIDQAESAFDHSLKESRYLARISGKTAALIEASCKLGALAAGASPAMASCLGQYGERLGLAFQVSDDILDFSGDPQDAGKPTGQDLRHGIITLPAVYLLEEPSRGLYLRNALSSRSIGRRMKRINSDLLKSGAMERARAKANTLLDQALSALAPIDPCEGRKALEYTVDLIRARVGAQVAETDILAMTAGLLRAEPSPAGSSPGSQVD